MTLGFDAVSLDVGGVLMVPDHDALADALDAVGVGFDRDRFGIGHYLAMATVDRAASAPEDFVDYAAGFLAGVGVAEQDLARGHDVLVKLFDADIWRQPLPGSREGLVALAAAGMRLGVTSNSDGRIERRLAELGWMQVGPGEHTTVEVITDSGVLGVGKPHPAMFSATVDAMGLRPDRVLHVGDSIHYDVNGALACGLQAVHMDPYGLCTSTDHPHVRTLTELLIPR